MAARSLYAGCDAQKVRAVLLLVDLDSVELVHLQLL